MVAEHHQTAAPSSSMEYVKPGDGVAVLSLCRLQDVARLFQVSGTPRHYLDPITGDCE
jgi:hypothetical protein